MRVAVVGAGAWGLPAAAELADRGHEVVVLDRYGVGNELSSSPGPTRVYRAGDPDPLKTRLGHRAIEAMDRLEHRTGMDVHRRVGLLWRDRVALPALLRTLRAEGIDHEHVAAEAVDDVIAGLRPDDRPAVWLPDAGVVLAAESLRAQHSRLLQSGGTVAVGAHVTGLATGPGGGTRLTLADGSTIEADTAVLAAGPGVAALLAHLGVTVALTTYAEQVVRFGGSSPRRYDDTPCLFNGPTDSEAGTYGLPTPGVGYKIGWDEPLRQVSGADLDRAPDTGRTEAIVSRARRFGFVEPQVIDAQVCVWTDSPDGRYVVDRLGPFVLACGDCGEGFKYSALMGEVLADLAKGRGPDDDVAALSLARLASLPADAAPRPSGLYPPS